MKIVFEKFGRLQNRWSALAHEMPKPLSTEPLLRFHSSDMVKKSVKDGDESEVALSVEQVGAPFVVLV